LKHLRQRRPHGSQDQEIGNAHAVLIPKPILARLGLEGSADLQGTMA
jgi:antitoxin component of MazEF toxin-antitoxin module